MKRKNFISACLSALFFGLSSCGDHSESKVFEDNGKLKVTATTTMVSDLVRIIGGEHVQVQGLMKPGVDPHDYDETFHDTAAIKSADLVFYSGLHLEAKMQSMFESMNSSGAGKGRVIAVTDSVSKDKLISPEGEFEDAHDPHVWGDPLAWLECIDSVVESLCHFDEANSADYRKAGELYAKELVELQKWGQERVKEIPEPQRVLVTSHDAFHYYARAFGFEVEGLEGLSTKGDASLKRNRELVEFIQSRGVKTVFGESAVNSKGIGAIARDAGVSISKEVLYADATGEDKSETRLGETYNHGSYIGMVKHNINVIVEGLK